MEIHSLAICLYVYIVQHIVLEACYMAILDYSNWALFCAFNKVEVWPLVGISNSVIFT
jgi:hypothetical protein